MQTWKATLLGAALFAATGPLFGTIAYLAVASVAGGGTDSIGGSLLAALWLLPFGYLLGVVPAALTGAIASGVLGRRGAAVFVIGAAAIGAAVSGGLALLDGDRGGPTEGIRTLAAIGAVSGALAAFATRPLLRPRAAVRD